MEQEQLRKLMTAYEVIEDIDDDIDDEIVMVCFWRHLLALSYMLDFMGPNQGVIQEQ